MMVFFVKELAINLAVACALCGISDVACQHIEMHYSKQNRPIKHRPPDAPEEEQLQAASDFADETEALQVYSCFRTLRYMVAPGGVIAFANFVWFQAILKPLFNSKTGLSVTVIKTAVSTLIYGPVVLATMIASNAVLAGRDGAGVWAKLRQEFPPTFAIDLCVFIPADFIAFTVIPQYYTVMFISVVDLFWRTCLSYFINRELKSAPQGTGS